MTAAGIPWFVAPFGRDSLIASLQTLHIAPGRAKETLRTLAALQGRAVDPFREEEPGKILHEMRYGEMARLGEIPHYALLRDGRCYTALRHALRRNDPLDGR